MMGKDKKVILRELVKLHQPDCYIEIGAHRLKTTLMLAALMPVEASLLAIDLYELAPREELPPEEPPIGLAEAEAIMAGAGQARKRVLKANSRDLTPSDLPELHAARRPFVFIDGGHSAETSIADFRLITGSIHPEATAIVVVDDADMEGTVAARGEALAWAKGKGGVSFIAAYMLVLSQNPVQVSDPTQVPDPAEVPAESPVPSPSVSSSDP